jgi:hypothetical protein
MISPKQTVIPGRDDPRRRSAVVSKSEGRSGSILTKQSGRATRT